jgi:hypothetical protein
VSNALASLIVIAALICLAFYFVIVPPEGFNGWQHRFAIPLVLVVCAVTLFESIRMRAHMSELVGVLRGLMGRSGKPPTADVKREAIDILVKSMRSDNPGVRRTAYAQLRNLTGQELGEDAHAWEEWWGRHRATFGAPEAP